MSQLLDENFLARMDQKFTGWSDPAQYLHEALANDELSLYYQPIRALGIARPHPIDGLGIEDDGMATTTRAMAF